VITEFAEEPRDLPSDGHQVDATAITESNLIRWSSRPQIHILPAEYGRADIGSMSLLRGAQIVHFGSLSGEERDIVIAACADD
jgi:hypothetical protein